MPAWTLPNSIDAARGPAIAGRLNALLRRCPPLAIYAGGVAWAAWLFWLGLTGGLGPEPINALERAYGDAAITLLIAGLAVTPLRRLTGISLLRFRRAIGVTCFGFALAHLLVWAILDLRSLGAIWTEIVKRPYVTAGMAAFLALVLPALTSNDMALRRLGASVWRRIHLLVYPAAVLAALHGLWIAKGFALEPIIHMTLILVLLALRLPRPRRIAPPLA